MVLDAAYVAEWIYQMILENNTLSMIPVRKRQDYCSIRRIQETYRKKMRREFDYSLYRQRTSVRQSFQSLREYLDQK